jgi:hypothetical protein
MNGKTMKLLSEYIADQHRRERERHVKSGYEKIYVQDTNGVEDDVKDNHLETFWPPDNKD